MRTAPSPQSFNPYPLALLAAGFACGVLLAPFITVPFLVPVMCGAICIGLIFFALARQRLDLATWFAVAALMCAGATASIAEQRRVASDRVERLYDEGHIASGDPVEVTGVLERAPEEAPDGFYLSMRVESVRSRGAEHAATGAVQLFAFAHDASARAAYGELELRRGARVRLMTALERADQFRNPGGHSLTESLERRGFDAVGSIKSPLLVERLDDERVLLPLVWLDGWRESLRARMVRQFSAETAGVLQAALLGNRHDLSRATAERFREGGTFHVLVISGLHVGFIGGFMLALMRLLTKRRAWQFVLSALLLWAYAVAVGAGASVVRAVLMFTLAALAPLLSRRAATLNALGGAALILLVWHPGDLFDPSFQLTFLSVLSIAALGWPLLQKLREAGAWRPTRATPMPPSCTRWWRALGETLFWSERAWRREMERHVYRYRLFKTVAARAAERWHVQKLMRFVVSAIIISASVQACTLPLLVIYFHRLSLVSIPLNVVVGMLMATFALCALAALLVASVSVRLAAPLVWLTERVNGLMSHLVDPFARAHVASLRLPAYTGAAAAVYGLYFVPLIFLIVMLARWRPVAPVPQTFATGKRARLYLLPLACLSLFALLCLIVVHPFSATRADGRLRVDFLDVGQGDAALVTLPDGATLLVDGGGRPKIEPRQKSDEDGDVNETFERDARGIGDAVVSEYLWWRGLDRIDYVLATHAHADHMEGLNDVARNFKIGAALVARAPSKEAEYARFAATMRDEVVPIEIIERGDCLRFGTVTADVLWPPRAASADADAPSGNNDSVVLRFRYGERTFLLTGDLESAGEAALIDARDDLRSDVVKAGHHGSRTSSSEPFVDATRPSLAVISVGLVSPFGHPDPRVVERWRAGGARVLQTGRSGAISVSTDGHDLRIETFARE